MNDTSKQLVLVVDDSRKLLGTVNDGNIRFYAYDGTNLDDLSNYTSVYIRTRVLPSSLSSVSSSLEIDEDLHDYLLNYVFEKAYSRFPVELVTQNGIIKTRDWQAVNYHAAKYREGLREGKIRRNTEGKTKYSIQFYQDAGRVDTYRPAEDSVFTSATEIS